MSAFRRTFVTPKCLAVGLGGTALLSLALLALIGGVRRTRAVAAAHHETTRAAVAPVLREIDFTEQPSYVPNDTLSLTFDDGPLLPFTEDILDILKDAGVHATFFITTDNNENKVDSSPIYQNLVRRIVREGHGLANHTVHHVSLKTITPAEMDDEVGGVERAVQKIFGPGGPRLTLFRAPYGEPYQDHFNDPKDPLGAAYPVVAPVVAKHAIHVGWNVETDDWTCTTGAATENAQCVYDHFTSAVKTIGSPGAKWGIVLMHCVNPQTVAALPRILNYVRENRFKLISVEEVVQRVFGRSSADVIDGK